ncbi:MAG TPA: proton-conducting transporter membrane subunit, partial [Thermoanaerobaculia bacterium]|nr:proton-conducting transporter membrane subunit [Thermoanaerobaculia bacterium]
VAHLGFVMLGLFALDLVAWQGALLQMVNHGISTGALFLLVGMLYDRLHTRKFAEFGGLAKSMPWFAFFLVFTALSSVGLPFLNGFAGEFLILAGSFRSVALDLDLRWAVVFATFGVVLAAIYLLKMLSRTLWGPITREENRTVADLDLREKLALAPLCVLMLWIGLAPATFLAPSRAPLEQLLDYYQLRLDQTPVAQASLGPALPWATGGGVHRVATEEGGPDDHPQASAPVVGAGLGTFPPDLPSVVGAGLRARPGVEPAKTAGDTP